MCIETEELTFWPQFFSCDVFCLALKKYDALVEAVRVYQSRLEHF